MEPSEEEKRRDSKKEKQDVKSLGPITSYENGVFILSRGGILKKGMVLKHVDTLEYSIFLGGPCSFEECSVQDLDREGSLLNTTVGYILRCEVLDYGMEEEEEIPPIHAITEKGVQLVHAVGIKETIKDIDEETQVDPWDALKDVVEKYRE